MRKTSICSFISLAGLFVFASLFSVAWAFEPPEFTPNVVDESKTLTREEIEQINERIQMLQGQDIWVGVAVLQSLAGVSIEEAAEKTFRKWQLGQKGKDNGLLFIFAINDRKARIEVGYGLEGEITDARSRRILDDAVMPHFRRGEFAEGILSGLSAVSREPIESSSNEFTHGESGPSGASETQETYLLDPQRNGFADQLSDAFMAWLMWVSLLWLPAIIMRCRRRAPPFTSRFMYHLGIETDTRRFLKFFLALNPGFFIALVPLIWPNPLDALGRALSDPGTRSQIEQSLQSLLETARPAGAWAGVVVLLPFVMKLPLFLVGRFSGNRHPIFRKSSVDQLKFLFGIDEPFLVALLNRFLFCFLLPAIFLLSIPVIFEWPSVNLSGVWSLTVIAILVYSAVWWRPVLAPLMSDRAWRRAEARKRLVRMTTRRPGVNTIFGKTYTYRPRAAGSGTSTFSSSSKSSSSSSSQSSSGGGRSGGGGASSGW